MAFLQVTFFSQTLGMNMDMDVLLPENPTSAPIKTVYLLHGMSDNQTNWQRYSAVERHILGKNVAVVMPTTHLAWYTDMWCGTEDGLLQSNRDTRDLLISKGFDVTYSESEGGHEWRCWDEQFRRSLDFFGI